MYAISIILFVFAAVAGFIGYSGMVDDEASLVLGVALIALGAGAVTLVTRLERGHELSYPR